MCVLVSLENINRILILFIPLIVIASLFLTFLSEEYDFFLMDNFTATSLLRNSLSLVLNVGRKSTDTPA